jgi:hypothetical protein
MDTVTPFKWWHFEAELILLCVRWYVRYSLSYRDLEKLMREGGFRIDHATIYRRPCNTMLRNWKSVAGHTSKLPLTPGKSTRRTVKSKNLEVPLPGGRSTREHFGIFVELDARCRGCQTFLPECAAVHL